MATAAPTSAVARRSTAGGALEPATMVQLVLDAARRQHKDPASGVAAKFIESMITLDGPSVYNLLDPGVRITTPMGVHHGRPNVKAWVLFDARVATANGMAYDGPSSDGDGARSATNVWHIGALTFIDQLVLNQVLQITSIFRTMHRRTPRSEEERKVTEQALLMWTGPHFAKYCSPKKHASTIDNHTITLPVLDYSHCDLVNVADMLFTRAREGKAISDMRVLNHFLESTPKETKVQVKEVDPDDPAGGALGPKNEVTIRAKNRSGDQNAIIIDKNALGATAGDNRVDTLMDSEAARKEDIVRYAASGLRLTQNKFESAAELPSVIRILVFNAFYFLNWVDLSGNRLRDVPDLSQYPVSVLYLHGNCIEKPEQFLVLRKLRCLTALTAFDNPVQQTATNTKEYKYRVLAVLRGEKPAAEMALKNFDHSVVSPSERENIDRFILMRRIKPLPDPK